MRRAPLAITGRLELREFVLADAEVMKRLNDDPEVIRYTGSQPFASVAEARDLLASLLERYDRDGFSRWATVRRDTDTFIGWCGLSLDRETGVVDVGFRFFRDQWGQGYATESALASLQLGFEEFELGRIIGRAMTGNIASQRVLTKIGMTWKRTFERTGAQWQQYEMTAEEWGIRTMRTSGGASVE